MNLFGKIKSEPADDGEATDDDSSSGKTSAARALLAAIESKDADAVVEAFETLSALCQSSDYGDEGDA